MPANYDIAQADQSVKLEPSLGDSAQDLDNEFPIGEPVYGATPSPTPAWTEGARFEPTRKPDPFPFLDEETPPDKEAARDAWVKLAPNSGLNAEEAEKHAETLRKYSEAEEAEELAKTKDNIKALYRTPEGVLQMAQNPAVRREMDASPDDDLVIKRALNRQYLSTIYGKPNMSPEEADALMREHSIKHWGINNPSQETFYAKTKEDILKADEETKVYRSMASTVAQTILKDKLTNSSSSYSETFEKFAKAHPKEITAQNKDQWYQTGLLMDERIRKLGEKANFPASQIIDLAEKLTTGEPTEIDWNRAINSLRGLKPNEINQALKIASIAVREQDPKGEMIGTIVSNISKRFGRDYTLRQGELADSKRSLAEIRDKAADGKLVIGEDAAGKPYYAMDGRPLPAWVKPVDQEGYARHVQNIDRELDSIRIMQTLQKFQENVRDPVTPYFKGGVLGLAEAGAYDVAGFSKLLPLGLIRGPAGLMTMAKVIGDQHFLDLTYQNPNLSIKAASQMSSLMGMAESLGMKFKADFVTGHFAFVKSMRTLSGAGKSLEAFKVYAKWNLVHNIEENAEELAQDTTSAAIQKIFADLHPKEMKQQSWDDLISDIASTRLQVAFAVAPLSMIGAAAATVRDLRNPMRDFMNPDALRSAGLKPEMINEVLAAGNLEEAEKVFRKHYNTLTPEDIKAGFEYAAGLGEQAEVDEAMADPVLPSIEPVVMPDGTYKYNVVDADGKILSTHTDPDTAELAWVRETERVKGEHWAEQQDIERQRAAEAAAAAASDEGVAKEAEARATAEAVSPEDRLGTALVLDFEENVTPTPEESQKLAGLQADVAAAGRGDQIVLARVSDTQTGPGKDTLNFVRAYEAVTGKQVVFVASGNDQPLSFTGVVRKSDPNTIFLDAAGDRNLLALIGHEWSHTLEKSNPELYREMVERMKPLVVDWAKQEGILAKEVGPENVTNEMVANIAGDMMSREDFWARLASNNPTLFEKVRDAVMRFFTQFINKVRRSEFGSEAFITDLERMRDVVADTFERAQTMPAEAVTGAGVSFAPRRGPPVEAPSFAGRRAAAVERETTARMVEPEARVALFQKMRDRVLAIIARNEALTGEQKRISLIQAIGEYNAMLKVLPPEIRGRVGAFGELTRIGRSEKALADFFTRQIYRIDKVLEQQLKKEYQERISDLLSTYKPKKTPGGVMTTKIGDAQAVIDEIRVISKMSNDEAAKEIASLEQQINAGMSPEAEAAAHQRQNMIQMFADPANQSAEALANSHAFLKQTIKDGRASWGAIEEARLGKQRAQGVDIRTGLGPSSPALAAARRDKIDRWKGTAASMYNFGQFMHDIFPGLPFIQGWVNRARDADSGIQDFMIGVDRRFSDVVRRFSGDSVINGGKALTDLNERTIAVPGGGKASKMEALQYLMSWAQADAQARMIRDGWTDAHIEAMKLATSDPLSQAISQFLRQEYDAAYNKINAVYKRMYGMNLPRISNYAPLRYEHSGLPEDVAPFGSPTSISGSTPTFAHARVQHSASLRQIDALTVYMQHMQQAAHFIHYAELVREMRGTLNDGKVKEAIGSNMGPYQADTINKWMDVIARGGTAKASEQLIMKDATAYLTRGTAISALAFNIKSAVTQLDSAFRWLYEIPPRAWLPAFLNPSWLSSVPVVWNSNAIQRRIHDGMNPISQHLMSNNNLTPGRLLQMTRLGMAPLRYTDAAGTTISSAIVFKYHYDQLIKSGATPEVATAQAAVMMDRAVHKFSQPTSLTSKSIVENTQTGVAKASLLFMSDPRMKTALLMEAFGDFRRGDIEMGVGKIVAGMAMGALTLVAANLFRDWASDDDDEDIWTWAGFINALTFGQFHGVFIAGSAIDYVGTAGLAKLTGEKAPYYGARGDILTETYKRVERVAKDPFKLIDTEDPDKMIAAWENVLRVMGIAYTPIAPLAGAANVAKTIFGVTENIQKEED